jgi:hypothetical protein
MEGVRTVLSRAANSLSRRKVGRLFFLHVPKCGGTSLRFAMSKPYRMLDRRSDAGIIHLKADAMYQAAQMVSDTGSTDVHRMEEFLLLYYMSQGRVRFIDGHVPFSAAAHRQYKDRFRFVTLLRDPVERWISEYTYNRFHGGGHMADTAAMDITDYLKTDFAIGQGCQYVLYLGGRRRDSDYRNEEAIRNARENTEKFDLIGCLEDVQSFAESFSSQFGWRLELKSRNVTPAPAGFVEQTFTPAIREQVREICQPDYLVYDKVRGRLQAN